MNSNREEKMKELIGSAQYLSGEPFTPAVMGSRLRISAEKAGVICDILTEQGVLSHVKDGYKKRSECKEWLKKPWI